LPYYEISFQKSTQPSQFQIASGKYRCKPNPSGINGRILASEVYPHIFSIPHFRFHPSKYRMLPCDTVLALLPVGPCRYFGPATCFVAYNIANALNMNAAISVLHSMFFRYRLIRATQMSNARVRTHLLITAAVPLFLAISPHVVPFHFNTVMEVAMREHPEYNLEKYGPFGGFYPTTSPIFIINSAILYATAVALPLVIFYWRHHILKALNSSQTVFTEKTRHNSRLLLKALTVQAVMPLLCYVPAGFLYFIAQFTGYNFVFLEYLFPIFTTLPCAVDPLVTIYFITPYRVWVIQRIRASIAPIQLHNNVRSSMS
ncbi:7TM chemoreceptor, partial [Ancylostoma caninum]